jgi:hypothetical protein
LHQHNILMPTFTCMAGSEEVILKKEKNIKNNLFVLVLAGLLVFFCLPCQAQKTISAQVRTWQGRPVIFLNGQPQTPLLYALTDVPGGRRSLDEVPQHNIRAFCEDGIRMFQIDVFLEQLWTAPGVFSVQYAKEQVQGVLNACPEAVVFIRLHTDAPRWWTTAYPAENVRYEPDGYALDDNSGLTRFVEADPRNPLRTSLFAERWQQEAGAQIKKFCRTFAKTKEGRRVAGIHLAGGVYGEWHQWGFLKWEADFSAPATAQFRQWLHRKYRTNTELQGAWSNPVATLDSAAIPSVARRRQLSFGTFRDARLDREVMDYYTFQHEYLTDVMLSFCRLVKENWPRPVITGAFYGYFFSCFNRQAAGGHLALQKVLRSPYIDYLSGPQAYLPEAFKAGEPYRSRSLLRSVQVHGKLWLDEMDQQPRRTFAYLGGTRDNREKHQAAVSENAALLLRNLTFALTKGSGLWLYDFGPAGMNTNAASGHSPQQGVLGYWDHTDYHNVVRAFKKIADSTLYAPYQNPADVLLVYDTDANYHTPSVVTPPDSLSLQLIDYMSLAVWYSGAVPDMIHLKDLERVDMQQYKMVVFANTFVLDTHDIRVIHQKVARRGRHLLWCVAPGLSDGQSTDTAFVGHITGFPVRTLRDTMPAAVVMNGLSTDSLTERAWGRVRPLFYVPEMPGQWRIWGRYRHNQLPAVVSSTLPEYTAWFTAVPLIRPENLRAVFQKAGVHCYTKEKDVLYGGMGVLSWHTKTGGTKTLTLHNGKTITIEMPLRPCTVILDAETGAIKYLPEK